MRFSKAPLLLALVLAISCDSSDNPSSPSPTLAGTWRATKAEFVSVAPPVRTVDVVAKGMTVTLVLQGGGAYTLTFAEPGEAPIVKSGTWGSSTDVLTLRQTGMSGETQFDYLLDGNTLMLRNGHAEFDFDIDVMEEARLHMTLTRQ